MTKIGIIGCGKIANSHINALLQMSDVKISAVCDVNKARCDEFAKKADATPYTSYEKMLDTEDLQLAIICLPPAFHLECTELCALKGVNVFVEKPMAITTNDCEKMIDICNKNGVMLWVGHMQRYSPENWIAKELIDSGKYGKLLAISEVRTCAYPGPASPAWLMDRKISGGGIMYNFGAHTLDMVKYLSGSKVVEAESSISFSNWDSEDAASGFLKLQNGVAVTFMGRCNVNRYEIVLYLSDGEIRIKPRKSIVACGRDGVFAKIPNGADNEYNWQYLQLRDVMDSLKSGVAKVDGEYGLEVIRSIEKLYSSSGRNQTEKEKKI